jgi:hypothetical protein
LAIKRFKWISGVLAAGMISFPSVTSAQTGGNINLEDELLNARKQQVIRQIEQYKAELLKSPGISQAMSGTTVQSQTSVTYSGSVSRYETHYYVFETTGGTIHVNAGQPEESVGYFISPINQYGGKNFYMDGDMLPAGMYLFAVLSGESAPVEYTFDLDGVTFTNVDNTLPKLSITSPSGPEIRVAKGTTEVTVEGSHDGFRTDIYHDRGGLEDLRPSP